MTALRAGYIRDLPTDLVFFLGLPFVAIAVALGCHAWLSFAALASFNLWITVPHHFSTWYRAYSLREDWSRWKLRFIVGPIVITVFTLCCTIWAPLTALLVFTIWDHQHSMMQQHGFARIYDYKAKAGSKSTGRWDFWLGVVLYSNMLLTSPLFAEFWIRELYRWSLPIGLDAVRMIQGASWTITIVFAVAYLVQTIFGVVQRQDTVNPMKYLFLGASYGLWYFASWHSDSALVFGIAHRIMHGVQYMVIVYFYLDHKAENKNNTRLSSFGVWKYIGLAVLYLVLYQLFSGNPLSQFDFGIAGLFRDYTVIPEVGLDQVSARQARDIYAATLASSFAMTHYYFDSFIWKVSDAKTQEGL